MSANLPALASCLARNPAMLRVRPALSLALLGYMGKFKARKVGGWTFLHSHLPPLDHPAYSRFIRRHLLAHSPGPSHAQVAITDACPQKCAYCYNKGRTGIRMDSAKLRRVVAELKDLGAVWLGWTGGEPLLNKDIAALTAEASPECAVKLFTTGVGLTAGLAEDLKRAGLVSVSVSLDHWTAEVHDAVRGYPGAFQAALRAIGLFREAGIHTGVSAVLSADMIRRGEVRPFLEFLSGLNLDEAWLSETKPSLSAPETAAESLTPDDRRSLMDLQDSWNRGRRRRMTMNFLGHFEAPEHFGCNAGTDMAYIDAFGEVGPCVFVPLSFGNVRERPLAEIWADIRGRFTPGSECFIRCHHRELRGLAGESLPIRPPDAVEFLKGVRPGLPGRFVTLLDRKPRRPS